MNQIARIPCKTFYCQCPGIFFVTVATLSNPDSLWLGLFDEDDSDLAGISQVTSILIKGNVNHVAVTHTKEAR